MHRLLTKKEFLFACVAHVVPFKLEFQLSADLAETSMLICGTSNTDGGYCWLTLGGAA